LPPSSRNCGTTAAREALKQKGSAFARQQTDNSERVREQAAGRGVDVNDEVIDYGRRKREKLLNRREQRKQRF